MNKFLKYSILFAAIACTMKFEFRQRHVPFMSGKGEGTITCDDGKKMDVNLKVYGGWVAIGDSDIEGSAAFSPVSDISKFFGYYYPQGDQTGTAGGPTYVPAVWKNEISLTFDNPNDGQAMGLAPGAALRVIQKK